MKKRLPIALFVLLLACLATPAVAQEEGADGETNWGIVGAALALGIAAAGCGMGQGRAAAGACEGIARNPGANANIRTALILGLAFIESLTIYALVIALILVLGGG